MAFLGKDYFKQIEREKGVEKMELDKTIEFMEKLTPIEYKKLGVDDNVNNWSFKNGKELYNFLEEKGTLEFYGELVRKYGEIK